MNVRLYVEHEGKSGLWFLSLDASNALAVWFARSAIHLPYHRARIGFERGDTISVDSSRISQSAIFRARYRPLGFPRERKSALEHFLTERYCLYTQVKDTLLRCDVHHWPWALQDATVEVDENSLLEADGLSMSGAPALTHFSRRLEVVFWNPVRVS